MANLIQQARVAVQEFEISGGNLALDFANTVSRRRSDQIEEHLCSYPDLIRWARQACIISSAEANRISWRAEGHPTQAAKVLRHAIELREAVFRIFCAIAAHQRPLSSDLQILTVAFQNLSRKAELIWTSKGADWRWIDQGATLEKILWVVVRSSLDLLTSSDKDRVRECEAETCGWLFMDHSKNRSRRWCDMKVCGNREKAKRFHRRNR
jgi:predicted RNA-binding Zn ribbon-like protein